MTKFAYELHDNKTHMFSAVDERGGMHFWVRESGFDWEEYIGGIECHYRSAPEYMEGQPASNDECWLLEGPCWHDGSSLQASEFWIPVWEANPDNHGVIFKMLASRMNDTFGKRVEARS